MAETSITIKTMAENPAIKKGFEETLGNPDKATKFMRQIISSVSVNPALAKCDPMSVWTAGLIASTTDLELTPAFGYASIVPYKKRYKDEKGNWNTATLAQFMLQTRGVVQLAQRSGKYKCINADVVYKDEFVSFNRLDEKLEILDVDGGFRDSGDDTQIAGFYAYFKLINGFEKTVYWKDAQVLAHARKYSQTYDKEAGTFKKGTPWADQYIAMGIKTVLKHALMKYGILSVEMQNAFRGDQMVGGIDGKASYMDNPLNNKSASESLLEELKGNTTENTEVKPAGGFDGFGAETAGGVTDEISF